MYRIILISITGIFYCFSSIAQTGLLKTDSLTWRLYQEKKWDQLLAEAEKSLNQGIDFYYLRVRTGVAAYELKKYRDAVIHFQKAYSEYAKDDFVNSYYYWALLLSGREDEANRLADSFTPAFLKQQQIKHKGVISGISAESLISFNAQYDDLMAENIETENSFRNFRSVIKQQQYYGFALDHHILPALNLYQSFSTIGIDRTEQFKSMPDFPDTTKETFTQQYQYYLNGRYLLGKGWSISASFSGLWGQSYYHLPEFKTSGEYSLTEMKLGISDYQINAGISKEMALLRFKLIMGFGEINLYKQLQTNIQVIIYPYKNIRFYLLPEIAFHWDESTGAINGVYNQKIGIKTGTVWLTGEYGMGSMKNFVAGEGMVVYNMPETIKNKAVISLWAPLFKSNLDLMLMYLRSGKEGSTLIYSDASNYSTKSYTFTEHSFLISLKWNL
jgi:hypothetical protein